MIRLYPDAAAGLHILKSGSVLKQETFKALRLIHSSKYADKSILLFTNKNQQNEHK